MTGPSERSPDTLPVTLREEGIVIEYTDGREVFYGGVPTVVENEIATAPGKQVHVLITDPTETEGVLMYLNDHTTDDEILAGTGVGRVLLDRGEETTLFPGVRVHEKSHRIVVAADPEVAHGRVFVFEEDGLGERSFELVTED